MNNDTLNALILRHGDNLLRRSGWPDSVDMTPVSPDTVPGWLVACGSLSAGEILTLTEQLCQPLTYGLAALLTAAECDDLLAFLKDFIDRICDIVRQDAQRKGGKGETPSFIRR